MVSTWNTMFKHMCGRFPDTCFLYSFDISPAPPTTVEKESSVLAQNIGMTIVYDGFADVVNRKLLLKMCQNPAICNIYEATSKHVFTSPRRTKKAPSSRIMKWCLGRQKVVIQVAPERAEQPRSLGFEIWVLLRIRASNSAISWSCPVQVIRHDIFVWRGARRWDPFFDATYFLGGKKAIPILIFWTPLEKPNRAPPEKSKPDFVFEENRKLKLPCGCFPN